MVMDMRFNTILYIAEIESHSIGNENMSQFAMHPVPDVFD